MGLGDLDDLDDGDRGSGGKAMLCVTCSICLDAVKDSGDRSWAKLQCGHQFHLDCIGSAFNAKGAMQCPNCRKIEKGQWLFANGSRLHTGFSLEDWGPDEDLYDPSSSEMSFGVHWCPFTDLNGLPPSIDEGEFPSSAYHEILGQYRIFEHTPVSSTGQPCPYAAYLGPVHPYSSTSTVNVSDGPTFSRNWSAPSIPNEVPSSYAVPSLNYPYQGWDQSSFASINQDGGRDQPCIQSATQRIARNTSDTSRTRVHPFVIGHSSASRGSSSVTSSVLPPFPGTIRPRGRPPLQAYLQQSSRGPIAHTSGLLAGRRRSTSHRGDYSQITAPAPSSDQHNGFYSFLSSSSGRTSQEAEIPPDRFHGWNHDYQRPSSPTSQMDRNWVWDPFYPLADTAVRSSSFRQRYNSERMPSQNWS